MTVPVVRLTTLCLAAMASASCSDGDGEHISQRSGFEEEDDNERPYYGMPAGATSVSRHSLTVSQSTMAATEGSTTYPWPAQHLRGPAASMTPWEGPRQASKPRVSPYDTEANPQRRPPKNLPKPSAGPVSAEAGAQGPERFGIGTPEGSGGETERSEGSENGHTMTMRQSRRRLTCLTLW